MASKSIWSMHGRRFTAATLTVVVGLVINPTWAFASDADDVTAAAHQFLDTIDQGTLCDSEVSIIDEFPPHEWRGPTACADWVKGFNAYNEKSGITPGGATLRTPWHVDVTRDRAYFVAPMTYTYQKHGQAVKDTAAFAVALRRTQAGWRITAWSYAKQ
jgi:hypothetical protein